MSKLFILCAAALMLASGCSKNDGGNADVPASPPAGDSAAPTPAEPMPAPTPETAPPAESPPPASPTP